ncbi:hypothetical protein M9458_008018, partial [Cirrhinus mrigala]
RTAADYAIEFRTLAAQSKWNEIALKAVFRRGLNVKLQVELACKAVDSSLNEFITVAIKIDNLMRNTPCSRRFVSASTVQAQTHPDSPEPMQIASTHLSSEERDRRQWENLCYYCGEENHHNATCPHKTKKYPAHHYSVSTIELPNPTQRSFLLECELYFDTAVQCVSALVDSGSAVNVINQEFTDKLKIPTSPCVPAINITTDNSPIGSGITATTRPVTLHIGLFHKETITFYVVSSCKYQVILGHPWLAVHDPIISWNRGELAQWSSYCLNNCLTKTLSFPCLSASIESPVTRIQTTLPTVYAEFAEVFSKSKATQLPPHRPWDCAIDLLPNMSLPKSKPWKHTLKRPLRHYIRPSTSPAAAGFFFVEKKDGGLRPCIDYRGLNSVTVKYRYPLPLVPSALAQLREARIYSKLDLRSAYNLIRIREGDEWKSAFLTTRGHYEYLVASCFPILHQRDLPHQGVEMDKSKVQAVTEWPLPKTVKELQRFLGFANFYRRFICDCSSIAAPITSLLKGKPTKLMWSPAAVKAFESLKTSFTTAPILKHPDLQRPFVVEVDALDCGIGAVLSQRHGSPGKLHPCAFFSRKLTAAERNYDVGNKENLSMKAALEEWRHWLEGAAHPFQIITDHKNLEYIKGAKRINPRQAHWSLFFTRFNFSVTYRPGSKNLKADTLSRRHDIDQGDQTIVPIFPPTVVIAQISWDLMEEIQRAQQDEPPPPESLHDRTLQWVHTSLGSGHPGINRTTTVVRNAFWWPTMNRDIVNFVKSCAICAQTKTPRELPAGLLQPLPIPHHPVYWATNPSMFPWSGEPSMMPRSERVWDKQYDPNKSKQIAGDVLTPTINPARDRKLAPRYVGPFKILKQINAVTYHLELPADYRISPSFHVSLLKPVHPAPDPSTSIPEPPPPLEIDGAPAYSVNKILDSSRRGGQLQYLVDWEGYRPEERSWVASKDILDPSVIQEFYRRHPNHRAPRPRGRPKKGTPGGVRRGGGSVTNGHSSNHQREPSPEY